MGWIFMLSGIRMERNLDRGNERVLRQYCLRRYTLIDHMFGLCTTSYKRKTKHFGAYIKMKACKVGSLMVL